MKRHIFEKYVSFGVCVSTGLKHMGECNEHEWSTAERCYQMIPVSQGYLDVAEFTRTGMSALLCSGIFLRKPLCGPFFPRFEVF